MAADEVAGVPVSKPDKVLFPDDGVTKRDLAGYYARVADVMLPHLRGRPLSLQRFPDGVAEAGFYEKQVPSHFPDWMATVTVDTQDGEQVQVQVDEPRHLVYLADQACVTLHCWLSRGDRLDRPDTLVLDLDPSVEDLDLLRGAVRSTCRLLADLGLTAFVKTTGSKGYHVQTPLDRSADFDAVRTFAHDVGRHLAAAEPDVFTVEQRKSKRGDRVYVDSMRNAYGQTAVPPYAVRARAGAPVATPITKEEVGSVAPDRYTIDSVVRRLAQREDPWKGMQEHARSLGEARRRLQERSDSLDR